MAMIWEMFNNININNSNNNYEWNDKYVLSTIFH